MGGTVVPADGEDGVGGVPFDAGGGDGAGELVLVFVTAFIEEVDLVGGGDGDGGVDGHVGHSYTDDALVVVLQVLDLGLGKKTHPFKFKYRSYHKTCLIKPKEQALPSINGRSRNRGGSALLTEHRLVV